MKKIVGIVITGITLLSIGTTFALSDSGTKLSSWYHEQFENKAQNLSVSTMDKLSSSLKQFQNQMKPIHQSVSKAIKDYQFNTLLDSTHSIDKHNEQYLNQLHTVTEGIKVQNAEQMAAYTEQKKQQETEQVSQDVQDILDDLLKN
jgi:hypothetical protein